MIKHIDVAVEDVINREPAPSRRGWLAEGGIAYVYDAWNAPLIPDAVRMRVETLRAAIAAASAEALCGTQIDGDHPAREHIVVHKSAGVIDVEAHDRN